MSEAPNGDEDKAVLEKAAKRRQKREERWEAEGERPLWQNMSMIGSLGWLIITPTLVGLFVGRWLDGLMNSGVTFSGALLFVGVCMGGYLAWKKVEQS